MKRKPSRSLIALSTTALALPGISSADAPPTESTVSYKISNYKEDDLSREQVPFGELGRYDIDVHQFQYVSPLGRNFSLSVDANYENMSGASPWFSTANANGDPVINMSGASGIRDRRSEVSIGARYFMENGNFGGYVGYSEEDDYRSSYIGVSGEIGFNSDLTRFSYGFSHAADDIFPTDAEIFNRVRNEDKQSTSAVVGLSQVINQFSVFQIALSATEQSGFLTDPYKLQDSRPDNKTQLVLSNSYRHFFVAANAALHADYRLYHDDFGITSHTADLAWYQNLGRDFQIVPNLRYYTQSAADFYTNIDDFTKPLTEFQSSDYRLSAFGAISGGIHFIADLGDWTATLTAERYIADDKYSGFDVTQPSPALVRFNRVSIGVDYSF